MSKKVEYALIYWVQTREISVEDVKNIERFLKPSEIKSGTCSTLPWTNENNETEIYDIKILKISCNKKQLESLNVSDSGELIQNRLCEALESEEKKIKKMSKQANSGYQKNKQILMEKTSRLEDLNDNTGEISPNTSNTNFKKIPVAHNQSESSSSSSGANYHDDDESKQSQNKSERCENCKKCICKNWVSLASPDIINFVQLFSNSLAQRHPGESNENEMVQLHPDSNFEVTKKESNVMHAICKDQPKEWIRQLALHFIGKDEMYNCATSEAMNKIHPSFMPAVLHFLHQKLNVSMTKTEYNRVMNRKIQLIKQEKDLPEEAMKIYKEKKRLASQQYRLKKQKSTANKKASNATSTSNSTDKKPPTKNECNDSRGNKISEEVLSTNSATSVSDSVHDKDSISNSFTSKDINDSASASTKSNNNNQDCGNDKLNIKNSHDNDMTNTQVNPSYKSSEYCSTINNNNNYNRHYNNNTEHQYSNQHLTQNPSGVPTPFYQQPYYQDPSGRVNSMNYPYYNNAHYQHMPYDTQNFNHFHNYSPHSSNHVNTFFYPSNNYQFDDTISTNTGISVTANVTPITSNNSEPITCAITAQKILDSDDIMTLS